MALLEYVTPADADSETRELLEEDADYHGHPPLFARAVANDPGVFAACSTPAGRTTGGSSPGATSGSGSPNSSTSPSRCQRL